MERDATGAEQVLNARGVAPNTHGHSRLRISPPAADKLHTRSTQKADISLQTSFISKIKLQKVKRHSKI
jgi:hypothetical protein